MLNIWHSFVFNWQLYLFIWQFIRSLWQSYAARDCQISFIDCLLTARTPLQWR